MRVVEVDIPIIGGSPPSARARGVATILKINRVAVAKDRRVLGGRRRRRQKCWKSQVVGANTVIHRLGVLRENVRCFVPAEGQIVRARLCNIEAEGLVIPADVLSPNLDIEGISGSMCTEKEISEHAGPEVTILVELSQRRLVRM